MKKLLSMVFAAIMPCVMVASVNDAAFMVSTPGIDYYSDGEPVNNGEKYALVWTTNNVEFAGFNCDGTLADPISSKLVVYLQAKKNHLRQTLVQIGETVCNNNAGTYSLYLLDTRVKNIHTGQYDFIDNGQVVTNIREYVTLAVDFKYTSAKQFSHMPIVASAGLERITAFGYTEPEVVYPLVSEDPVIGPTNMVAEVEDQKDPSDISKNDPDMPNAPVNSSDLVIHVYTNPGDWTGPDNPRHADPTPAVADNKPSEPEILEYLPERFQKNLVKNKWKTMYKKLPADEEILHVFKKNYVKSSVYQKKTYILNYNIYNLVPESYLDVCQQRKYLNKFSEHWVITTVFVMSKLDKKTYSVTAYDVDENFGMIPFDYFECTSKEKSKVLKSLKKVGLVK